jgi:hypothetical protein
MIVDISSFLPYPPAYFDVSKNQLTGMIASTVGNLEVLCKY